MSSKKFRSQKHHEYLLEYSSQYMEKQTEVKLYDEMTIRLLKSDIFFREPARSYTPFMEAAAAGHEIIVQSFLQHVSNIIWSRVY